MYIIRHTLSVFAIAILLTGMGCSKREIEKPSPVEPTRDHACSVCGMIIVDFPGSKGQIHYTKGRYNMFCSTLDMFLFYLQPDRPGNISAVYVEDIGDADWKQTETHWIDAKSAFYVYGGDRGGPMGEALAPFSDIKDADAFMQKHDGRIVQFDDINMDMLRPGAES